MDINWNLARVDGGANALSWFEKGQAMGAEMRKRQAYADFAKDPTSIAPINALIAAGDPSAAIALRGYQTGEQDRAREAKYQDAQSRYILGGGYNALAGHQANPAPAAPAPAVNAPSGNAPAMPAPNPASVGAAQNFPAPNTQAEHPLGQPQNDADRAFLEMLSIDPKRALQMQGGLRDEAMNRLKQMDSAYDFAITRLVNVSDDAGYQALLTELDKQFTPLGIDIRTMVPPTYPGRDGSRQLLLMAMDAKDQLHALVERERLDAYKADLGADNARADRNTDSLIRARENRQYRGSGRDPSVPPKRRGRGGSGLPVIKTPDEARKLPSGTKFRTPDGQVKVVP